MHYIDWIVMGGTLAFIVIYGVWKSKDNDDSEDYLLGNRQLKWWTIGLSIMATQASAITFLSTPGQAYSDGMRFIQFYFGLPLAMIFLSIFVLPIFYRLKVITAYEYLEQRFDLKTRTLAASLFLIQRGIAAAISIYAPSIILSSIFGWSLPFTNFLMAVFVLIYTIAGGSTAVSKTQEQQMLIMLLGMIAAFVFILLRLPAEMTVSDAFHVAGNLGKTQAVDFEFDPSSRYNFWSGTIGAFFLFLAYFGTDQSQVGRYLSGKTLAESRMGLLLNGMLKIPMQTLILLIGVMVFVFYQFHEAPVHFKTSDLKKIEGTVYEDSLKNLEQTYHGLFEEKKQYLYGMIAATKAQDQAAIESNKLQIQALEKASQVVRDSVNSLIKKQDPTADTRDRDYIFISFVLKNLPVGLVGLILAAIFCASWSTTASELTALSSTCVVDIYRRSFAQGKSDRHYLFASRFFTLLWGVFIVIFASSVTLPENLIQAVNIIGSFFYGTLLGVFLTAFFLKRVGGTAVFIGAIAALATVLSVYYGKILDTLSIAISGEALNLEYLWLNPIGCFTVMIVASIAQIFIGKKYQE
jgi:SSS family solute:Na+ symporter